MKILLLANKLPYPANDGSSIAIARMIEGFVADGIELTVLVLNTKKHFKSPHHIPPQIKEHVRFEIVEVNTNPNPINAFFNLFQSLPFHVSRFYQKAVTRKLVALLRQSTFDVVQAEGLFLMPYAKIVKEYSQAKIALRAHNIEHLIWKRATENESNLALKQYLRLQTHKLKRYEMYCAAVADAVIPISPVDAAFFKTYNKHVFTTPCGITLPDTPPKPPVQNRFFHLGAMDWLPNQQGVDWLIEKVWPLVYHANNTLELHLAGRAMPQRLLNLNVPGITVQGEVDNASKFRTAHGVMLVPLLAGSGMRIKIIEGLAEGLPILSTHIGAEGIQAEHGKNIWLSTNPEDFAAAMLYLASDRQRCIDLGKNAAILAAEVYQNHRLISNLAEFYKRTWQ